MPTELYKETMTNLANDYKEYRLNVINKISKDIDLSFKDYVEFYLKYVHSNELEELDYDYIEDEVEED